MNTEKINMNDIPADVDQNGNAALYDQKGNFMGWGGAGKVTVAGADPTNGGQKELVSAGFDQAVNGVSQVKGGLPGWNKKKSQVVESSNGGQSVDGGVASAEKKVEIPRREDRPAAYPTKARRDADAASSVGQELTDEQKAAVQNAGATPSPLSPAEQEAEKKDIEAGKSNTLNAVQLQGEKELNPESSNTGAENGGQSVTAANGGQSADGGKSSGAGGEYVDGPSEEEYKAAKKRKDDAMREGKLASKEDWDVVFQFENRRMKKPEMPELLKPDDPPAAKSVESSFKDAYAKYLEKMREAELDPESRVKRYKARRARRIVAAIGDLLQAAANMVGAYRGADSAKLTSMSKAVHDSAAKEDALNLKKSAQLAKELESDIRRGESLTKEQNRRLMEIWKAGNDNIKEKNRVALRNFEKMLSEWDAYERNVNARERDNDREWYKQYNAQQSRQHQKEMENLRTAGRLAVKRQPSTVNHFSGGGGGKKNQGGTPVEQETS